MLRSAVRAKRDWADIAGELFFQEPFFRDQAAWLGNSLRDSYELGRERGAQITWLKAWAGVLAFLVLFIWTKVGFLLLSVFGGGN